MEIKLTITRQDDGQVRIEGPIEDKLFCYGVLELAKEAISDYHKAKQNRIVTPALQFPANVGH